MMKETEVDITANIVRVRERLEAAAKRAGRNPGEIKVVAVTKGVGPKLIQRAIDCGLNAFGENRVQELLAKIPHLPDGIEWHFVGHLQSNKVKKLINRVSLIHSLDRWSLAQAISREALKSGLKVRVLVEVNVSGERTKAGVKPDEVKDFVEEAANLPGVLVCGLMTIAPFGRDARPCFRQLREIFDSLNKGGVLGWKMEYLSMGMSADFEVAVEEGANLLRIGSAIFGQRE